VFLMDMWATVPYYTAYLAKALMAGGEVEVQVGSISYYLDPACFTSRGIRVDPGLMNVVGRYRLPRLLRRPLKLAEGMVNLAALTLRFAVRPPDVVHVQYLPMLLERLPMDLWFVEFCQWRGAKVVLTVHDLMPHDTGEEHRPAFRELYGRVDGLICHSESVRARLATEFGVAGGKVSVVAHGPFFYDLPESGEDETPPKRSLDGAPALGGFGLEGAEVVVLWQGILFPYKGVDVLLRAWRTVEARVPGAWLVVAGTGSPELLEGVRSLATELGLRRVRLEFRFVTAEQLVALYRRADVVVYPYRAITTSGALATGLALGKAIVASDLPVFRELLTDRENALLVAPEDAEGLAGALVELAGDAGLRERLAGRVRAMDFGDGAWRQIAEETVVAYGRVLEKGLGR
jgi:glycosyltransferase involved in cell wall biosynthesis